MRKAQLREKTFVDIYFNDIFQIPLLSREEEIFLAKKYTGYKIKEKTLKERKSKGENILDYSEKINYFVLKQENYKNQMIQGNYRLVVSIAKCYRTQHFHLSDLIDEGNLGLIKAVEKFDHRKGFRFSTFAIRWIKQHITKAIIDKGRMIRIPVHLDKLITKYKKVTSRYQKIYGESPSKEYLEKALDVPYEKIESALALPGKTSSLDVKIFETGKEISELIVDKEDRYNPHEETSKVILKETLDKILSSLEEKERMVLKMRYGFDGNERMTLDKIGKKLGITRERVRQIQSTVLKKMRNLKACSNLKVFLTH